MKIEINAPTPQTPGFLRRSKQAYIFMAKLQAFKDDPSRMDISVFDDMIEFLLPFVTEPKDPKKAREALWEASQEQFEKTMQALVGGRDDLISPPNGGS